MKKSLNFSGIVSSKLQNEINISIIFDYLRKNEPISRADIARNLSISRPTVSRVVETLIEYNYVVETEKIKTSGGKRPIQLKINPNKDYVLGIDLGKERIKIALTNFNGEIIKNFQGFKISDKLNISEKMISEIKKILSEYNQGKILKQPKVKAMCIGVPARIDVNTRKIISSPIYKSWENLNLKEILSNEFGIPVYIENDVILSALGEQHYGEGKKFKDVIFIEISKGIGAGIIADNRLFRGSNGTAGEIAFTILGAENLDFKIKKKGFLEKFVSVENIKKKAIKEIKKGRKTIISDMVKNDIEKIEPSLVCKAATRGDELANDIITEMVNFLSIGIINLILIQNPQVIVLGGDICNLPKISKLIVEPIIERIKRLIPFEIPKIKLSSLGEDVGVIGASFQAMESLLISKFPYKIEQEVLH